MYILIVYLTGDCRYIVHVNYLSVIVDKFVCIGIFAMLLECLTIVFWLDFVVSFGICLQVLSMSKGVKIADKPS